MGHYWGTITGNPDWCEHNYAVTAYVAEFWNTLSSVPIFAGGAYGLWQAVRKGLGWQYVLQWVSLMCVGLGSITFHGTLLFTGQAMDELAMVYTVVIFLCVSARSTKLSVVCGLYLPAFTYSYFAAAEFFYVFGNAMHAHAV
jgi:dihydroceramidase